MFDNTPGFDWAGDVQADYGDYGLPLNDTASKWGWASASDRMWAPPRHDPSLSNAARVNYAGSFGGAEGFTTPAGYEASHEDFATKRSRFTHDPNLIIQKRGLDASLDAIGVSGGPPGDDSGGPPGDVEAQIWAGRPSVPPVLCRTEGFSGRERLGQDPDDIFSDHNLLVLIFVLVLFLAVRAMIGGAVRSALAEHVHSAVTPVAGD